MNKMKNKQYNNVKATVGAILVRNEKILLEKRNIEPFKGKWCIPGGHIEHDETSMRAIKREVKEETGLKIKNPKFLFYFDEELPKLNLHAVVLIFKATPIGKGKSDFESSELKWFSQEEIKPLKMALKHKQVLNKYFNLKPESKK